jgi:hypothetical protein
MNLLADVGITSGHVLLADWLFLLAAIAFVVEAVAIVVATRDEPARPTIGRGILIAVGLALAALGWLVL